MSHVFPRHTQSDLPTVASGDGVYLYDTNGKQYFDGSGGAAVSCLGHSDQDVTQAIKTQLDSVAYAHTSFLTSQPAEDLADRLVELAPGDIDRAYFLSGGSEAIEAALKLARQYYWEQGQTSRQYFIARKQSYHGNTLAALATGGNEWRRAPFGPLMIKTGHISPCYAYRGCRTDESEVEYGLRVANELETQILELGAENVIGFVAETVAGATSGAVPPVEGYFKRIRDICNQYDILLILDEVMCGMGRTGSMFACEQDDIAPDIVTIAKGLGAGYQPISAMLCTAQIYNVIAEGSGFFQHGHTYVGHPTACAASLAVVNKLVNRNLLQHCAAMGEKLQASLVSEFGQHPHIGDIRGRGLFRGIEFVQDRESKKPFPSEMALHKKLKNAAFEAGLICYPMGGTVDGVNGDHILLAPPFILDDSHIDEIVDKLATAFRQVL
ncbi:MAG: aspartate aminotransferase family protein [Granulosicoccus sp.]